MSTIKLVVYIPDTQSTGNTDENHNQMLQTSLQKTGKNKEP